MNTIRFEIECRGCRKPVEMMIAGMGPTCTMQPADSGCKAYAGGYLCNECNLIVYNALEAARREPRPPGSLDETARGSLHDYAIKIEAVKRIESPAERKAALDLVANEIRRCAWNPHARAEADRLAGEAQAAADAIEADALSGLDALAAEGHLRSR